MKTLVEFIAVVAVAVMPSLAAIVFLGQYYARIASSTAGERLPGRWLQALSAISVVLYVALNQRLGLDSVGIYLGPGQANGEAILVGFIGGALLVLFIAVLAQLVRVLQRHPAVTLAESPNAAWVEALNYRRLEERITFLIVIVLGVIAEDLVYRGYLVLLLGARTGSYLPWAFLSITLSVLVHLYQGLNPRTIISQLCMAALFVVLAVLTHNVLTPIVAHLTYNLMWTLQVRNSRWANAGPLPPRNWIKTGAYTLFIAAHLVVLALFLGFQAG